jgi:hypothetical protein
MKNSNFLLEDQSTDEAIRKLEDSLIKFQSSAAITAEKLVKIR